MPSRGAWLSRGGSSAGQLTTVGAQKLERCGAELRHLVVDTWKARNIPDPFSNIRQRAVFTTFPLARRYFVLCDRRFAQQSLDSPPSMHANARAKYVCVRPSTNARRNHTICSCRCAVQLVPPTLDETVVGATAAGRLLAARATAFPRTVQSACAFLQGLYPQQHRAAGVEVPLEARKAHSLLLP